MANLPDVPEDWQIVRYERGGKQVIHSHLTHYVAYWHAKAMQKAADVCDKDYVYDIEVIEYE